MDTTALLKAVEIFVPGESAEDKKARAKFIITRLGLEQSKVNVYKLTSGRIISLRSPSDEKLHAYLSQLKKSGINIPINKIINASNIWNEPVLHKKEAFMALNQWINQQEDETPKAEPEAETKLSREFFDEILKELRTIRELNEETCRFIKTLVFALNGEPAKEKAASQ